MAPCKGDGLKLSLTGVSILHEIMEKVLSSEEMNSLPEVDDVTRLFNPEIETGES